MRAARHGAPSTCAPCPRCSRAVNVGTRRANDVAAMWTPRRRFTSTWRPHRGSARGKSSAHALASTFRALRVTGEPPKRFTALVTWNRRLGILAPPPPTRRHRGATAAPPRCPALALGGPWEPRPRGKHTSHGRVARGSSRRPAPTLARGYSRACRGPRARRPPPHATSSAAVGFKIDRSFDRSHRRLHHAP